MKRVILPVLFAMLVISINAQNIPLNITGRAEKRMKLMPLNESVEEGAPLIIDGVSKGLFALPYAFSVKSEGKAGYIAQSDLARIKFDTPSSIESLWQTMSIGSDSYRKFISSGPLHETRKVITEKSLSEISKLEENFGLLHDDYIDWYIRSIIHKIHPPALRDDRPGVINVVILKYNEPLALSSPTGTVILSTGLISTLRSERELLSVLALEVSHFILDHNFQNLNSSSYTNNFTLQSDNRSFASVFYNLGAVYSPVQMEESEKAAMEILKINNLNRESLAEAMMRIREYYRSVKESLSTAPARGYVNLRSNMTASSEMAIELSEARKHDAIFSWVNTLNAGTELTYNRYDLAVSLVDRNIEAGSATEDDYLIKVMAMEALSDTPEKSMQSLELVAKAKSLGILPNNYLNKQEALILLRLGRNKEAAEALIRYLENLTTSGDTSSFITEEIQWTQRMLGKVTRLQN